MNYLNNNSARWDTDITCDIAQVAQALDVSFDEIQRALYHLEGKMLAEPVPPGNLTSRLWRISSLGADALGKLTYETAQAVNS
ncbi:hypothetical protein JNK13_10590 [bacterium]|nr:hypothetical protein [bacterium]